MYSNDAFEWEAKRKCPHKVTFTFNNDVKECLDCHKLLVPDTPRMRELYDGPQFDVEWKKEKKIL